MKLTSFLKKFSLCFAAITILLSACDPVPGRLLTDAEKTADMEWLYSIFGADYAPQEYKEQKYGFKIEDLKRKFLRKAHMTKTNDEFYLVMQEFVAQFRDAHTSLTLTPSELPGRATIAFLGFSVERSGDDVVVTQLLPTVDAATFPLKVNDHITQVNGIPVMEYIDKVLVPYRNLGNPESNHTAFAGALFNRLSLQFPIPKEPEATLTVKRATKSGTFAPELQQVKLPWIVKDLRDYKIELANAKTATKATQARFWAKVTDQATGKTFEISLHDQTGHPVDLADLVNPNRQARFLDRFKFTQITGWDAREIPAATTSATGNAAVTSGQAPVVAKTGLDKLKDERWVPDNAVPIPEAHVYPAYIAPVQVRGKDGKPTGRTKTVGYLRIDTFDPNTLDIGPDNAVTVLDPVAELKTTLKKFAALGVKDIVLDTMTNPGGSLDLLLKVSALFSNKPLHYPGMQFGLNDSWLDSMEENSLQGSAPEKELFSRIFKDLRAQRAQGLRLSRPYTMDELIPFQLQPNYDLKKNFNIVMLTDEMNASCGDIFPLIMKENGLAKIVGEKTMGAGGNVVNFTQAPNSHADVRQTMSLIVKKSGDYLENNGVEPDVEVDFRKTYDPKLKFKKAMDTALELVAARAPLNKESVSQITAVKEEEHKDEVLKDHGLKPNGPKCDTVLGDI